MDDFRRIRRRANVDRNFPSRRVVRRAVGEKALLLDGQQAIVAALLLMNLKIVDRRTGKRRDDSLVLRLTTDNPSVSSMWKEFAKDERDSTREKDATRDFP